MADSRPPPSSGGKTPVLIRTLAAMADKHGPIFTMRIGMRQALAVSSKETILGMLHYQRLRFSDMPKVCRNEVHGVRWCHVSARSSWTQLVGASYVPRPQVFPIYLHSLIIGRHPTA
ncbi:hypothetical protein Vadar_020851 [Vaccinium darrowii]|uniref:Uncharacterized protein n=1 Tax=Vaccinium darrowii TaxID=229202 RepID=A0ACB7ZF90_9ERIC|nr:hypothetical protein Vadar_020851 [Vaccinium darrowii]